ncbi:hypothetical protein GCM10020001_050350 [Nonomuraea salmonea]
MRSSVPGQSMPKAEKRSFHLRRADLDEPSAAATVPTPVQGPACLSTSYVLVTHGRRFCARNNATTATASAILVSAASIVEWMPGSRATAYVTGKGCGAEKAQSDVPGDVRNALWSVI